MASETVNVRYMVNDVEEAISWYTQHLGFNNFLIKLPHSRT